MRRIERPTLKDVAQAAGLSVTQTSRALNGHADVAATTRDRVRGVAVDLGYTPNLEARRLQNPKARRQSLGLVLVGSQRFSDPFFGTLLTSMVDQASAAGYELQLSAPPGDEDPIGPYERAIQAQRVDGFVVLRTGSDDSRVRYLLEREVPFVTFGRADIQASASASDVGASRGLSGGGSSGGARFATVTEHPDCLQPAVDHLAELGHRRLGALIEPLGNSIGAGRLASLRRAAAARGLALADDDLAQAGYREATAYEAARKLLDRHDRPSALVASNDLQALGALRAAADCGLSVPDDLSIVGFDDIAAAEFTSPPLTTLRHPDGAIGRNLVDQLIAVIEEDASAGEVLLQPDLIVRQSSGPCP